ncbi:hypothetical protein CHS0354_009663 [Potamilus streckersoni]|uniref:NACHT domain-containing protein n=1 Tax=Potamilus streckersoni TaxID=2493646 RepID=A0AAE0VPA2_9BIVA|nr:hypothetical protein CHS0354_009663 [Potamilus streckersoni]
MLKDEMGIFYINLQHDRGWGGVGCIKLKKKHKQMKTDNITEQIATCSKEYLAQKELSDTVKYLRELYKDLVTVPLSPSGESEDYVNVSELYVNISFKKVEIADLKNEESNAFSGTEREDKPLISNYQASRNKINQSSPIFLFGDCGSGKSAWCKHLVQCWLQCSDVKDVNIECLGLPDLQTIKILLYLPLQFSDRGISFQELLRKHIFKETRTYEEFVMNYVKRHSQKVLIIMDGLDIRENVTPISDISNDKYISSCTVVVTARPASLKLLKDTCHVKAEHMRLFRVSRMTLEDATAYASSILKHINQLHEKNFRFEDFWRFTEHLHINDLLSVPYICLVILHVWMENENCFTEITHILFNIIYYYLQSATSDQQRKEFIESVSDRRTTVAQTDMTKLNKWNLAMEHEYLLHVLSRVAAQILYSEIEREPSKLILPQIFPSIDEDDRDLRRICESGLLTEPLSLSANKKVSDMTFPDRLIFQFFVSIFIALREGQDCDFILSNMTASMQNSMIIHMLFQLSDKLVKTIVDKTIKSFKTENTNSIGNESNEKCRYCITFSNASPVLWLHSFMYNDAFHATKLLFLSTALHCIDKLNSLELTNHENNENLVFQIPCLSELERLTLDINNCTLLLCKEWDSHIPRKLKEVVIRSVNINTGTLGLFIHALGLCAGLEKLELFPSLIWTDDNNNLSKRPNLANYSWNELSKCIQGNTKLKTLEFNSLILFGVVDTLLSRLFRYENLENITLKNLSSTYQEHSPPFHSCCTDRGKDDIKKNKMKLTQFSLEKLKLFNSPMDFLFFTTKNGETKTVTNKLKVLTISKLEMPEKSWETLGSQIGYLTLSELRLSSITPGGSLQILLDSIGTCKEIKRLFLCNINTGNTTPRFSFLANLKQLSKLHLRGMKLDVHSSCLLFKAICECKQLQILSLCNIDIEEVPKLHYVRELKKLSKLTADNVTIKRGSGSLSEFLNAFTECKNLQTLYVSKQNTSQIPSKLSAVTKWI